MRWRFVLVCGVAGGFAFGAGPPVVMSASHSDPQVVTSTSAGGTTNISGMTVAEPPVFGTGLISGVVTDGTTGQPIEGVVVQLSGGRPGPGGRPQEMTDSRGRFLFTHLGPFGDYTVSASKLGYLDGGYKRAPGSTASPRITLRDGEWLPAADVQLWRTASISGTVLDDQGDPVVGVPVRALLKVRVAGRIKNAAGPSTQTDDRGVYRLAGLSPGEYIIHVPSVQVTIPAADPTQRPPAAPAAPGGSSLGSTVPEADAMIRTERGLSLVVGYFATPPAGGGAAAYAMAYHPAARSMDAATPVTLSYGDQRQNVDVQLSLLPTVRVSGRVLGPAEAVAKLPVRLLPLGAENLAFGAEAAFTTTDTTGAFTFLRVPSGDYTLIASRSFSEFSTGGGITTSTLMPRSAATITSMSSSSYPTTGNLGFTTRSTAGSAVSGRAAVSVGERDVDDVLVTVATGVKVSGHFLFDGAEAPPSSTTLNPVARLEPVDGDMTLALRSRVPVRGPADAPLVPLPLSIEGVAPGRYFFGGISAGQYSVESIAWNDRDVLVTPLEVEDKDVTGVVIRMTSKPATVTGTVRDASGPATTGAVIAFPAAPAQWRDFGMSAMLFRTSAIAADGAFRLERMIPGEYLLAAVPDEDRNKWLDPDYLASIAGSSTRVRVTPASTTSQSLRILGGGR